MSVFDRAIERAARFLDDVLLLPDAIRVELEDAEKDLAEGRHHDAEKTFALLLGARPNLLRAQIGYARALAARGELVRARLIVAQARDAAPDDPALALLAARLALEQNDLGGAITAVREAIRRLDGAGPLLAEACALRARAELLRGRPDRAARELRKAVAAAPDDVDHKVALIEALARAGDVAAALRVMRNTPETDLGPDRAARLGLALRAAGEVRAVRELLERAARAGHTGALVALAEETLASGDVAAAEQHARMAIARGGGAAALQTLAGVLEAAGRAGEAAEALLAASASQGGDHALAVRAARTVPLDDASVVTGFADRLGNDPSSDPLARAIRAHALLLAGDRAAAATLLGEESEGGVEEPRLSLARARLHLAEGDPRRALGDLDRLAAGERLRPGDAALAGELRRQALRRLYGGEGELDLAAVLDQVVRMAEAEQLPDLLAGARKLRDELDRPLLLAILGEFNAGKSTLVNAFVGAEVAPTGILPTTATLNVLRGGAERRVRVVRKDGTTREGGYEDVRALLAAAGEEGHAVDHVEIVLPSELLERVWILDTPGSNAPDPDHERLAREAMHRADAALWIFDAGQAGKATEGSILAAVRRSRREVVAALNKIDRLKPGELEVVNEALRRSMPELTRDAIGVSARAAVKARLSGDAAALEASGFPALMAHLESEVFARARPLKRRACAGRLLGLIEDVLATEADVRGGLRAERERAQQEREALGKLERGLSDDLEAAIDRLESGQAAAFHEAAREVLAFVQPRTSRFTTHGADPEDRAFLRETMEGRLEQVGESVAASLLSAVTSRLTASQTDGVHAERIALRARAAITPPIAAFGGYQAGLLGGGELRRFFDEVLPRVELSLGPITEALAEARAHPREHLKPALEGALSSLVRELSRDAEGRAVHIDRREAEIVARRYEPLQVLHEVLVALVDGAA